MMAIALMIISGSTVAEMTLIATTGLSICRRSCRRRGLHEHLPRQNCTFNCTFNHVKFQHLVFLPTLATGPENLPALLEHVAKQLRKAGQVGGYGHHANNVVTHAQIDRVG